MAAYKGLLIKNWIKVNCPPFTWNIILLKELPAFRKQDLIAKEINDKTVFDKDLAHKINHFVEQNYYRTVPLEEFKIS